MDYLDIILNELSLDNRVDDGIPNFDNPDHMEAFHEIMLRHGISEENSKIICNQITESKGKHPERQAFNKNGILVTFPTPDHKNRAIAAKTHFDQDPTKSPPNIFDEPQQQSQDGQNQQSQPVIAPPSQKTVELPKTEEEKNAEIQIIKQILRSDNSVLEEACKWLSNNAPEYLKAKFTL